MKTSNKNRCNTQPCRSAEQIYAELKTNFPEIMSKFECIDRYRRLGLDKDLSEKQIENILYLCRYGKYPEDTEIYVIDFDVYLSSFTISYVR